MVESLLPKQVVVGSNPIARSKKVPFNSNASESLRRLAQRAIGVLLLKSVTVVTGEHDFFGLTTPSGRSSVSPAFC
ncbi:hypothetical protein NSPZN2_40070 [Nitrospira defluvii]|uniref:Uncharacterized protein n=1 Tax=Nitrospira defluvii TaxID=330214 RepID=A0ABN7LS39_9BACT|nr:hypothetical protein NSPZN2_40070 [Nitrospira defluvii]